MSTWLNFNTNCPSLTFFDPQNHHKGKSWAQQPHLGTGHRDRIRLYPTTCLPSITTMGVLLKKPDRRATAKNMPWLEGAGSHHV